MPSIYGTDYFIDKSTGPPADALLAQGFAALLLAFAGEPPPTLRMQAAAGYYHITLERPVEPSWTARQVEPLPRLVTQKHPQQASKATNFFGYEEERRVRDEYRVLRQQLFAEKVPPHDPRWDEARAREPSPFLDFYAAINQMSAIIGFNSVVEQWASLRNHHGIVLELLLRLFSTTPNPMADVEAEWKRLAKAHEWTAKAGASASQVINPGMGKGINSGKSVFSAPNNISNFWLLEYLKFLGGYQAMTTRVVAAAKDRKSYVPEPHNLTFGTARTLFTKFQRALRPTTAVKLDIFAILRWLAVYLETVRDDSGGDADIAELFGIPPGDYVQGLWVVSYKDMGSALAVMNMALLRLPRWMGVVENRTDADQYLQLVEEHRRAVNALDESHSDAYDMLVDYRHFLTGGDLRPFYRFCGAYSQWLMRRLDQRQFAPQFTVPYLEVLFMAHTSATQGNDRPLAPVLADPGFQNIAYAIRHSTIIPQYRKAQGERLYDIRYGMGGDFLQKSRYASEFLQELTKFVFQYNQENARVSEQRGRQLRRNVTTDDVARVVQLVDDYGASTVAGLLVAFGYASDRKRDTTEEPSENDDTEPNTDMDAADE